MYIRLGKGLAADPDYNKEVNEIEKRLLALLQTFRDDFPKSDAAREQIGHKLRLWAYALPWIGDYPAHGEKAFREAVRVFEQMTKDFPDNWSAGHLLADSHRCLGQVLERSGKTEAAETEYRQAITLYNAHQKSYDEHTAGNPERTTGYLEFAEFLARTGRLVEAQGLHRKGCDVLEKSLKLQPDDAVGYNELAWRLAASPIEQFRDPARAVELAKKAVELAPKDGNSRNTLGVSQYRAGDWQASIEALEMSMELRKGGDASDWFFLAMAKWQLHDKEEARTWYDRAIEWMKKNQPKNEELLRFRAEAAKLLGITEPKPSTSLAP